jgi:adenine-specific DNA-methyltransferase
MAMLQKSLINQLINDFDINDIEKHMINSFLIKNNLFIKNNKILNSYFKDYIFNQILSNQVSQLNLISIKDLEKYLELLIPPNDRKLNGAFFTPDYIINYIIKDIKPKINDLNLDPSCGCGAFLVGLTEYYKLKYKKTIKSIIKENIFGSDILEYNILRTKLILTIYALLNNENLSENDFNLYLQDSLRAKWDQKFNNIVGNPPYVKFQDLTEENRKYLSKKWTTIEGGTYNLYFAFFELGYNLLTENGNLGFITPNNFFTSLSGESLRRFFQNKKCVEKVIDFSHKKVFDAQTYTAITFINKKENQNIKYDRISDDIEPEYFLEKTISSNNKITDLNVKKWRLLKSDEQENIKKIENSGLSIGKLFDISVGIATLKDEVFFVDGANKDGNYYKKNTIYGNFKIEKKSVKSVFKISDFKTQEDIKCNNRKIIFPYKLKDGTATPYTESEFESLFPKCYEYLKSFKEILIARDKGKVEFIPFFVWGRTQGLVKRGIKLLTPTFSQFPRFLLVEEEDAYFTNGYGIFFRSNNQQDLFEQTNNLITRVENIDVVQKILNSEIMHYYVKKTSVSIEGGFPCYQKNFIEKFTIPELSQKEIEQLRKINDENKINKYLIEKYQLNMSAPNRST